MRSFVLSSFVLSLACFCLLVLRARDGRSHANGLGQQQCALAEFASEPALSAATAAAPAAAASETAAAAAALPAAAAAAADTGGSR